jgi:hypothetical protein
MSAEDSGLTLEGLAQRLEALERENERMRSENDALQSKVATLEASGAPPTEDEQSASEWSPSDGQVSRKWLLGKAGTAAVAAMAAGTLLNPREAKAHYQDDYFSSDLIECHALNAISGHEGSFAVRGRTSSAAASAVDGTNFDSGPGVTGENNGTGPAVEGTANASGGTGVKGTGRYGVWGESNQAGFYGVFGRNTNADGAGVRGTGDTGAWGSSSRSGFSGVYGQHTDSGFGVVGDGGGAGRAGVLGRNPDGTGVRGEGSNQAEVAGVRGLGKTGVWGSTGVSGYSGVYGEHTGSSGFGVVGDGKGSGRAGVLGRNPGGYGGQFDGGLAQLKLNPKGTAGKPTSGAHTKGEIYLDSAANLFVCTASGTPGTWSRVRTVAT